MHKAAYLAAAREQEAGGERFKYAVVTAAPGIMERREARIGRWSRRNCVDRGNRRLNKEKQEKQGG